MGNLMMLKQMTENAVIFGNPGTHTHRSNTHHHPHFWQTLHRLCKDRCCFTFCFFFLGTKLCLKAQILTFIYFWFYLRVLIFVVVLSPCRIPLLLQPQQSNFYTGIVNHLIQSIWAILLLWPDLCNTDMCAHQKVYTRLHANLVEIKITSGS